MPNILLLSRLANGKEISLGERWQFPEVVVSSIHSSGEAKVCEQIIGGRAERRGALRVDPISEGSRLRFLNLVGSSNKIREEVSTVGVRLPSSVDCIATQVSSRKADSRSGNGRLCSPTTLSCGLSICQDVADVQKNP